MGFFLSSTIACVLLAAAPAMVGPPDAQTILRQIEAALEPERPSTRTLVLSTRAEGPRASPPSGQPSELTELRLSDYK